MSCAEAPGQDSHGLHGSEGLIRVATAQICGLFLHELEVQLQPKLELPRVEGGGGAAEVAAVAGALVEGADVVDEWRRGGFVEAVEQVEAFRDQLQPEVFAEWNQLRQAQIEGHVTMRHTHIACKASTREHAAGDQRHAARCAGNAQRSIGEH